MKKKLFVLFGLMLTLTACAGRPSIEDRIPEGGIEMTYEGVVQPLEIDLYSVGTHLLAVDEETNVVMRSRVVNLNNYLEQEVKVTGLLELVGLEEKQEVFTVEAIEKEGEIKGEQTEYRSTKLGYNLSHLTAWTLIEEGNTIFFTKDGNDLLFIRRFEDAAPLEEFVAEQEEAEGAAITVAAQQAFRFIEEDQTKIYISNPSNKSNYRITFKKGIASEEDQEAFFALLESLEFIYTKKKTGPACGGEEAKTCEEGFICELDSNEENAAGICISIEDTSSLDCPFIPVPTDCNDYQISSFSKEGCPTGYKCLLGDESTDINIEDVFATFDKYKSTILDLPGVQVISKEDLGDQKIEVTYATEEKKYTTVYTYTPSANEFNFVAIKTEEEDLEEPIVIEEKEEEPAPEKEEEEVEVEEIAPSLDGFNTYNNTHKDFSVAYHKNWYFRSFGPQEGTVWSVGFAKEDLNALSDATIVVEILEGASEGVTQETGGMLFKQVDRDDDTHFLVKGPLAEKEIIEVMASSIE